MINVIIYHYCPVKGEKSVFEITSIILFASIVEHTLRSFAQENLIPILNPFGNSKGSAISCEDTLFLTSNHYFNALFQTNIIYFNAFFQANMSNPYPFCARRCVFRHF